MLRGQSHRDYKRNGSGKQDVGGELSKSCVAVIQNFESLREQIRLEGSNL